MNAAQYIAIAGELLVLANRLAETLSEDADGDPQDVQEARAKLRSIRRDLEVDRQQLLAVAERELED